MATSRSATNTLPTIPQQRSLLVQHIAGGANPSDFRRAEDNTSRPSGWMDIDQATRENAGDRVKDCKEDMDTLLVFAGLYSAVLSAFLIDFYKMLQPDPEDRIISLLEHIASQSYSTSSGLLSPINPPPPKPSSTPPLWAVRVNLLWFISLVLSLSSASFAILVKQWLREYLSMEYTTPQQRLRARQFRRSGMETWKVFEIAACLPLLLQIALGLFFFGLCTFTKAINGEIGTATRSLVYAWISFLGFITLGPLLSPRCPYKTTLLKAAFRFLRRWTITIVAFSCFPIVFAITWIRRHGSPILAVWNETLDRSYYYRDTALSAEEEGHINKPSTDDEVLLSADIVMPGALIVPILDTYRHHLWTPRPPQQMAFILRLISHYTPVESQECGQEEYLLLEAPDLRIFQRNDTQALMEIILNLLAEQMSISNLPIGSEAPLWARNAVILLLSPSSQTSTEEMVTTLIDFLAKFGLPNNVATILTKRNVSENPLIAITVLSKLSYWCVGVRQPPELDRWRVPADFRSRVPLPTRQSLAASCEVIIGRGLTLRKFPDWIMYPIRLLFAATNTRRSLPEDAFNVFGNPESHYDTGDAMLFVLRTALKVMHRDIQAEETIFIISRTLVLFGFMARDTERTNLGAHRFPSTSGLRDLIIQKLTTSLTLIPTVPGYTHPPGSAAHEAEHILHAFGLPPGYLGSSAWNAVAPYNATYHTDVKPQPPAQPALLPGALVPQSLLGSGGIPILMSGPPLPAFTIMPAIPDTTTQPPLGTTAMPPVPTVMPRIPDMATRLPQGSRPYYKVSAARRRM